MNARMYQPTRCAPGKRCVGLAAATVALFTAWATAGQTGLTITPPTPLNNNASTDTGDDSGVRVVIGDAGVWLVLQSRFAALPALLRQKRRFPDSASAVFRPKTAMRDCSTSRVEVDGRSRWNDRERRGAGRCPASTDRCDYERPELASSQRHRGRPAAQGSCCRRIAAQWLRPSTDPAALGRNSPACT